MKTVLSESLLTSCLSPLDLLLRLIDSNFLGWALLGSPARWPLPRTWPEASADLCWHVQSGRTHVGFTVASCVVARGGRSLAPGSTGSLAPGPTGSSAWWRAWSQASPRCGRRPVVVARVADVVTRVSSVVATSLSSFEVIWLVGEKIPCCNS